LQRVVTQELAERATQLSEITVWEGPDLVRPETEADIPETLQLVAAPIIMDSQQRRLGAILAARLERPFSPGDLLLLQIAENQIDSAIVEGYEYDKLRQRTLELDTIYRVDRIRDQRLPLDTMLNQVVQELSRTIEAEIGFIMLYDRSHRELEMRANTHQDLLQTLPYYESIDKVIHESLERAVLVHYHSASSALRSIMCLPLKLDENIIGVLGMVNRYGARGFTSFDRRLLSAIGSQIDTAIYERDEIGQLREVLGRVVDPHVLDRVLTNPDAGFLKGEKTEITVLYADIRKSTELAERTEAEPLVEFIKDYLSHMTDVILKHEGTVDKFVGDEVMALFSAPVRQDDHALRAVQVGLAMQAEYQAVQSEWQRRGLAAPPVGIGIATGELIAGEMGGPQRTQYTVIGRAANLGARICGMAEGGQVVISQRTYDLTKDSVEAIPIPGQRFKGVADDVTVYQVKHVVKPITSRSTGEAHIVL
jgi:adenylate cyclase